MLRFLTERESRKVRRFIQTARDEADDEKAAATLTDAIRVGLVDVQRVTCMGKPVTLADDPQDYLSTAELWELAYAVIYEPVLSELDKKKLGSASELGANPTVPTAPASVV